MKISGYSCIRNNFSLDYCIQQTIESLLPVCNEVVISESESTDGTREFLDEWTKREPKLRIVNYKWPNPWRDVKWWTTWINEARQHLQYPTQIFLDADEVLSPEGYAGIREAAKLGQARWFRRLNFWKDPYHLVASGTVCADQCVRLGPTDMWMPSDEPHPDGEPPIILKAGWPPSATPNFNIFHYGFLRKERAMIDKCRIVGGAFFGTMDARLEKAELQGTPWLNEVCPEKPLQDFLGDHPEIAKQWLRGRMYNI